MQKFILTLSFVWASMFAFCDTLDFYHVYFNDSLLGKYNSLSEKPFFVFKSSKLKDTDAITVRYGTDHPCYECHYVLSIPLDVKEKNPEVETKEHFGKLSIPIKELRYFQEKYGIDRFYFNYHFTAGDPILEKGVYLFELKII